MPNRLGWVTTGGRAFAPMSSIVDRERLCMTRCLVTGGAGFIGSHLTTRLLEQGHEVVVLDNLSTGRAANLAAVRAHPRLTFRAGSITDPLAVAEAVRGTQVIYHMAAAVGVKLVADDPVRTIETNIYPTDQLLRLAVQGGQRFFLASTSEVYGKNPQERWTEEENLVFGPTSKPRWAYGCSKAIDEFLALAYARQFGLPVVVGRFFNVVGPRQVGDYGMVIPRFVARALAGEPLVVYDDGLQQRCFAHVSDVVECVLALMETPTAAGAVYNIGGDEPVSMRRLAELVIELVGATAAPTSEAAGRRSEAAGRSSEIVFQPYHEAYGQAFEDVRRRVPDLTRLQATIGKKPSLPLADILRDIIAALRDGGVEGA